MPKAKRETILFHLLRTVFWIIVSGNHWLSATPKPVKGKDIFLKHCAECHGNRGEGVDDEYSKPLIGDWPRDKLTQYIEETMPDYDPALVKGQEAETVSHYIYNTFYQKPGLFAKTTRPELAHLTNRQYRQSVADLFAQFEGKPKITNPRHGLVGKYFNTEGMNKRKSIHTEKIDSVIDFNYSNKSPLKGMNPNKFSIYWEGSILPRESGWYEFFVKSPNGFEFRINQKNSSPTIEQKVSTGMLHETSAKLYLLGGRPYPFSLNYFKFDDPKASIELRWKTPIGKKEIIPADYFYTQVVPPSFVIQQKLPPDDASHGYERGTQVDGTWDEAITYAALDAAKYASRKIMRLAKPNNGEEKQQIIPIVENFVRFAFREKLSEEELTQYVRLKFSEQEPHNTTIEKIVLFTLKSPRFLYPEWQTLAKKEPDPYVIASRLALYFWDSIPDQRMHKLIESNNLHKKIHFEKQAKIMLKDSRTKAKFTEFMIAWLDMKNKELPRLDHKKFPNFSALLALDLRRSLLQWVENNVWEKSFKWNSFLGMDKVYVNARIAEFYGIQYPKNQKKEEFWEIDSSIIGREGLHTHPYVLVSHSYPDESSPIHRGIFTSRKILGRMLRPPTEAVSFENSEFDPSWTMRRKVEELTKSANCMSCHDLINPTGFLLEGYDAAGKKRSKILGQPIDLRVNYLDSDGSKRSFEKAGDLIDHALQSSMPPKSFVYELLKYLAKQPSESFVKVATSNLSKSLKNNHLSIPDLYMKLCYQAAFNGINWIK
ncbi:DUF1592 domain-containing protein [Opitutales bacterium]|mgnify:CR=1 FL=1|jgi:hypothetical protein|nr:DUF1592 domain-containing protein [Opitutales bacterium]